MPQIGESVSPAAIATAEHDDDCYFCNAGGAPQELENDTDDDPDEDEGFPGLEEAGIRFRNDASKLGRRLGGAPAPREIRVDGGPYNSSAAAHHLIPGNASLKSSKFFEAGKYVWTHGKAKGNIGYDVNSKPNGLWLPGNYSMRGRWAGFVAHQQDYAFSSIEEWKAQFHDSHSDYSDEVRKALDAVFNKLEAMQSIVCPEAKNEEEKEPEERVPMYVLVSRFHTISARMRKKLTFPVDGNWFRNIFTSVHSLAYMNDLSPPAKRKKRNR